jgi:hypothetical protein
MTEFPIFSLNSLPGLQECYEACLSLNLEDFSLNAGFDENPEPEEDSEKVQQQLFLEYASRAFFPAAFCDNFAGMTGSS